MVAYIIFDVEDIDPGDEYVKLAGESLAPFQAKAIIHGDMVEVLGGDWEPKALVMLEFESMEQARQWYKSPGYAKATDSLHRAIYSNAILVEGV